MQDLVEAVHVTGARSFLPVPGTAYNDPSQGLTRSPTHASVTDLDPPAAGEIGEHTCGQALIDRVMNWFDDRSLGTTAPVRTTALPAERHPPHNGTPTAFATGLRDHPRAP